MSVEDQPQRPRLLRGTRWNRRRSVRPTCCGWCSAHTAALREKSSRRARILQGCSTERRSRNKSGARPVPGRSACVGTRAVDYSDDLRAGYALRAGTPGSGPRGTPEEISRGQVRPSGRRPRKPCRVAPCPNGASKKKAQGDECWRNGCGGTPPKKFLRCPAGAGSVRRRNPGAAPAARACPRLISCGVPPGRRAKPWRLFFGRRPATGQRENPRGTRGLCGVVIPRGRAAPQGARLCPSRTSRSGPASSEAPVGIGGVPCDQPAAAGAPRTRPRSGEG